MRIVDIAAAAGVSPSTVSRVIHGGKNIAPATAELVRRTMREMGYYPGSNRKVFDESSTTSYPDFLRRGQATVLTFSYQSWLDSICCLDNLNCLSASLVRHGLGMNYLHWPNTYCLPADLCEITDGFILLQGQPPSPLCRQIHSKPVVSLFSHPTTPGDHILMGHYQAGHLVGDYFRHRGLDYLTMMTPCNPPGYAEQQAEGFRIFCRREQISFSEYLLVPPADEVPLGPIAAECMIVQAMEQLIEQARFPVGVFMPSCCLTALAYRYLQTRGIQPGKDVQFVCLGYQVSAIMGLCPRPAYIDMGLSEIAENTAQLLILRIKNPQSGRGLQVSVTPRLVAGEN
ncbi:MAG: LacI family DNA-binding transcriptional regulator [Sedimentisphaerales bacterium]|nr:LacI family DNA-binding transcriptional regulator [Sedimentisphaerales bacterium]